MGTSSKAPPEMKSFTSFWDKNKNVCMVEFVRGELNDSLNRVNVLLKVTLYV